MVAQNVNLREWRSFWNTYFFQEKMSTISTKFLGKWKRPLISSDFLSWKEVQKFLLIELLLEDEAKCDFVNYFITFQKTAISRV